MFCTRIFLDLTFCLMYPNFLFKSFLQCLRLSLASHVLSVKLTSVMPVQVPQFFASRFPSVCIFYTDSISTYRSKAVLVISFLCLYLSFFQRLSKEFINILLKDLHHFYKCYLKVFILCFSFVGFLRVYFRIAAGV